MKRFQGSDAECLVETLDREIRGRGRGAIGAVNRATGHAEGWWQHRAESGDITVGQLLQVLDHLGLDPVKFLRRALGAEGGLELDRPVGDPPEVVRRAWERFHAGGEGSVGMGFLDTLDHQRYQEPAEVVDLARWGVDHVELGLLPRLLGIAGSAWRLMIRLEEAAHAIYAGIEMAEGMGGRASVGNLLLRLTSVAADRGDHAEALRLSKRAALTFLRCGDKVKFGEALATQGIWLCNLDRPKEAIETLEISLEHLPADTSRHRFGALQNLGLAHQRLGNLSAALEQVRAAEDVMPDDNPWAEAKLLWLRARIEVDLGELASATLRFKNVAAMFRGLHYGEAALATCELARTLLLQGRPEEAIEAATSLCGLLEPLRGNKIISAAIGDLLRSGQHGLTLALVKRTMARIEDERLERQSWRSLRIRPSGS